MLKPGSHGARSTNWNWARVGSKAPQSAIASATSMSEVQSAIQRALRATASASPRSMRMSTTPAIGRKVTSVRMGKFSIAASEDLPEKIPGDEQHHADQHDEGIVVEISGLQQARADREPRRRGGEPVGTEPIDHGPVTLLPELEAERHGWPDEEPVVELVEIPFVEEEE